MNRACRKSVPGLMLRCLGGLVLALAMLSAHADEPTASQIEGAAALQRMGNFMSGL